VFVVDGDMLHVAATHGVRPERIARFREEFPIPLAAETDITRRIRERRMFHLADIENNRDATPLVASTPDWEAIGPGSCCRWCGGTFRSG
jgi:hypothetical protein